MVFLFIGLAASGVLARLNLIAARGGWLHIEGQRKPVVQVLFELFGAIIGLAAFAAAFTFLSWWIPLLAFVIGYRVIPGLLVTINTF